MFQLMDTCRLSPVVELCATAWISVLPNMRFREARVDALAPPPTFTLRQAAAEEEGTWAEAKKRREGERVRGGEGEVDE